jgi:hypothetical protein
MRFQGGNGVFPGDVSFFSLVIRGCFPSEDQENARQPEGDKRAEHHQVEPRGNRDVFQRGIHLLTQRWRNQHQHRATAQHFGADIPRAQQRWLAGEAGGTGALGRETIDVVLAQ